MIRRLTVWLRRRDRAVTSIEVAILLPGVLLPLTFAILGAGLVLWTQGSLQSTADLAARCGAIHSPDCTGGASGVQSYAVTVANQSLPSGTITTADVKINSAASNCTGISSNVEVVEITATSVVASVLPPPFNNKTIDVCAYYPKCPTC